MEYLKRGWSPVILVDSRTGSVEIASLLQSPIVCTLEFADFAWSGNGPDGSVDIGVERKSVLDLLQSMTTGRLSGHQMVGLTAQYDWVYLLVEGVWRADRKTGLLQRISGKGRWQAASQGKRRFMARDVWNYLNTLRIMCGVITVCTSSRWETAMWLTACHGWWSKEWGKHKSHLQFVRPVTHAQLSKPNIVTRIASQLDGIGWGKAQEIGKVFPTPMDLLEATEDELASVDGIGPKLAQRIKEQLDG